MQFEFANYFSMLVVFRLEVLSMHKIFVHVLMSSDYKCCQFCLAYKFMDVFHLSWYYHTTHIVFCLFRDYSDYFFSGRQCINIIDDSQMSSSF